MPVTGTWIPDIIDGAQLEAEAISQQYVRTGLVTDITAVGDPDPEMLWNVLTILATAGITLSPASALSLAHPTLFLRRVRVTGFATNGARVALLYSTPDLGPPSAFIVTDSSTLTSYQTDLLPGTRVPLRIPDTTIKGGGVVGGDNVLFNFLRPIRKVGVAAVSYGVTKPSNGIVGKVNAGLWNGKAQGFWLCDSWITSTSRFAGWYTLQASAITKEDEDWSESGMLIDRATGKRVELIDSTATATAMMALAYAFGIIYANDGMIRVGPYKTQSFAPQFMF